ncbi:histamine H1 receptor-like [Acanthaster planci]|uniref:Histamine H1 receptor-like n=1 Tax=Acanthaster planci TaxID=133434 RepID=A0A8B7XLF7_ACAPL|nr:histamine H1 receptor-like [Acanthaster planci]XP_022080988.1 histamine H1 receptor-like [Acanthaster planci]XP_022080989.1 histamine H1 receptor-like [Acanthaster planci]XP_022080990.1 histamine H1 receptor-like [Acanthaster planci]XP_022080991.1 histamine H1 receptor-like [Acanthaster planci]XP_022080992.1 histamine H1 receptor-like [Acanthaster planci]
MASGALSTEYGSWLEVSGGGRSSSGPGYVLLTNTTGLVGGGARLNDTQDDIGPRTIGVAVPFATFMTLLSLITIFGNSLVIYAVKTEKRLQTVSNYFIVSLAVSDFLIGLIVMPISTTYFVSGDWVLGIVVCQIWLCIDYVSSTASIFNLLVLSLDRYWSIRFPLKYMRKRTGKRATIMISCAWLVSSLWIIPITCWHAIFHQGVRVVPGNVCDTEFGKNKPLKVGTAIGNFYIPLACLIFIYAQIFHEIQKRSKMVLGRRSVGGTRKSTRNCDSAPSKGTDLELTRVDNATWTPDYDDSISTSKDTSNETPDQTENNSSSPSSDRGRARRPKRINSQLRNISNLTLLTVGLHGMVDPEAVKRAAAGKNTSPGAVPRGSCTRSPCCHGDSRLRETQFLSPGDAVSRKESSSRHRHHIITGKNSLDRDKGTPVTTEEARPLRNRTYQAQNGSRRSILRRNSTVEADSVPNGTLSSRKISFSSEDLPGSSSKQAQIGCMPTKKKLSAEYRGSEMGRGERENKGRRNGVTTRLLSVEQRVDASATSRERDEDPHPPHQPHHHHPHLNNNTNPRGKFSLSRFSMRPGRATETLRRIRKMSLSKERKAAKQLGVIVGCFICCWATYMIFFMIVAFCSDCIDDDLYLGSIWLGYINSTLNPFIYPMCNSTFRKAFKKILRITKR